MVLIFTETINKMTTVNISVMTMGLLWKLDIEMMLSASTW